MNFFKSVFSDDPEPSDLNDPQISKPQSPNQNVEQQNQEDESIQEYETDPSLTNPNPNSPTDTTSTSSNSWSFGGLIKTITSKSETVIQTYKRDLEEFGSGLKMETVAIREAASRAVKDLPASIEVGASKAHGSLESVTHVIDEYGSSVWRGTSEIITLGKDALLSGSTDNNNQENVDFDNQNQNFNRNSKKYNRFEANVNAIQNDKNTYLEQPDDLGDFEKWKLGFDLEGKGDEIENLLDENGIMEGIYSKIVPKEIDGEVFWTRYFYRVYKLKQVEDARANLVKRATLEEDEDLSWDVDDDGSNASESKVDDSSNSVSQELEKKEMKEPEIETKPLKEELQVEKSGPVNVEIEDKNVHVVEDDGGNGSGDKIESETNQIDSATKSEENVVVVVEEKNGSVESSKSSEFSVIPSEKSMPEEEEEDLGWDEIEDVGSGDEKKVSFSGNPNRAELHKRLSTADEDEDLSWDIEDDDEPIKH